MTERKEQDDEDGQTLRRVELRLHEHTYEYLSEIKKRGVYGKTVTAVIRTFIEAGIREAIDKNYVVLSSEKPADGTRKLGNS